MKLSDNIQLELETDEAYALYRLLNYSRQGGNYNFPGISSEQSEMLFKLKNLLECSVCQSKW